MSSVQRGQTATIAAAGSSSSIVDLFGKRLVGFIMPAAWTAADIAFSVALGAEEGLGGETTFRDLYDQSGNRVKIVVAAAHQVGFNKDTITLLRNVRHLKFVSINTGTGAAEVQAVEAIITPIVDN